MPRDEIVNLWNEYRQVTDGLLKRLEDTLATFRDSVMQKLNDMEGDPELRRTINESRGDFHRDEWMVNIVVDKIISLNPDIGIAAMYGNDAYWERSLLIEDIVPEFVERFKRLFQTRSFRGIYVYQRHDFLNKKEKLPQIMEKAFRFIGAVLRSELGDKFQGTYWAGGSDVEPCKHMGGFWNFVALDYETGEYDKHDRWNRYDDPVKVREAGFVPVSWDVNRMSLPKQIANCSQDVALVKRPGCHYKEFKDGLWYCVTESLRAGGILISSYPIIDKYAGFFVRMSDIGGIEGPGDIELLDFQKDLKASKIGFSLYRKR